MKKYIIIGFLFIGCLPSKDKIRKDNEEFTLHMEAAEKDMLLSSEYENKANISHKAGKREQELEYLDSALFVMKRVRDHIERMQEIHNEYSKYNKRKLINKTKRAGLTYEY